jgi:hypothetical protein
MTKLRVAPSPTTVHRPKSWAPAGGWPNKGRLSPSGDATTVPLTISLHAPGRSRMVPSPRAVASLEMAVATAATARITENRSIVDLPKIRPGP